MSITIYPSSTLGFHRPFTSAVTRTLTISNNNAKPVLFKVKTTAPLEVYYVTPNPGRVEPGQSVEVQFMQQAMKEEPPLGVRCKDKFLIQSTIITPEMERLSPYGIWNTAVGDNQSQEIRVAYLPPEGSVPGPSISAFSPPGPTPQRYREQELYDRFATVRGKANRLRAPPAAIPEPKAKEEEPQSEPSGMWGRHHRTTSAVAGTEVSSYVDELHRTEAVPLQIDTQPSENRRIHLDQQARSSSATNSPRVNSPPPPDLSAKLSRKLHDRINSFIQTGASNSAALTEDCKIFFQENSSADHQDLHVTYQLLNHFLLGYHQASDNSAYEGQERLAKEMREEERCRVRKAFREVRDRGGVLA